MNNIDIFTSEDYENINLDYPEGYLEEFVKVLQEENKELKGIIETYEILLRTQQKQIDDVKEWFKAKQILTDIDDVCDTDKFWKILGDSNE